MSVLYDPEHVTYFAETDFRNQRSRFGIKSRDRTRHMYVIGKSGVGKSTMLENMAIQDIQHGEGVAVLDPHGSFADKMLEYVPEHRIKDVVYFAPFDTENPISFNVLEDVGHDKRHLVASGLMSSFKKIWVDAWSARMEYILNNILLALLEFPDATLLGVNRMLSDKAFRNKVVENITDPSVKSFWTDEFAKYGERYMQEAGAAIQNKIGQFTANPLVRNIIGQSKSTFNIRTLMDEQKILIINLSKGRIGDQNTSLLGSMIITKIYLSAMSRAELSPDRMGALPNFYFYVDEFQSFANETFADILAEARKYKLALIIAHQYVAQMEEKVRDAVFGNVGTTVSFRVGPLDAELLEKIFSPQFTANDLVNLGMAQIYLTLMINDIGSPPFSARTLPPLPRPVISYRNDVIEWSRSKYAYPKEKVEQNIKDWYAKDVEPEAERPQKKIRFADDQTKAQRPFKEAFAKSPDVHSRVEQKKQHGKSQEQKLEQRQDTDRTQIPLPEEKPTPALKALLESLDLEKSETPEPIVTKKPQLQQKKVPEVQTIESQPLELSPVPAMEESATPKIPAPPPEQTSNITPTPKPKAAQPLHFESRGPTEKNKDLLRSALKSALSEPATADAGSAPPAPEPSQQDTEPSNGEVSTKDLQKILK